MTFFLLFVVLVLIGTNVYTGLKLKQQRKLPVDSGNSNAVLEASQPKAIANPKHQLQRTFFDRSIAPKSGTARQDYIGWHFICSCGTIAPASDNRFGGHGEGTEAGAVKGWHSHASLYAELVEAGDNELEKTKKELEEHLASCICKDLGKETL